jgi:hypothetical protein
VGKKENSQKKLNWKKLLNEEVVQNWIKLLENDDKEEVVKSLRLVNTHGMMPSYFLSKSIEDAFLRGKCSKKERDFATAIHLSIYVPTDF